MHLLSLLHIPENSLTGNPHRRPTRLGGGVARSCRNRMCWSFQGDISRCEHAFWLFRSFCPFLCVYYIYIQTYIYVCVCDHVTYVSPIYSENPNTPNTSVENWDDEEEKTNVSTLVAMIHIWSSYAQCMPMFCHRITVSLGKPPRNKT